MDQTERTPGPWETIEGKYTVRFLNGDEDVIQVKYRVVTSSGIPLYLVDTLDRVYNHSVIISYLKLGD